ncbi:hypothetical protein PM8797T_21093 [Gimesia maris DSM 8797]|nr:hypothetical protein PM8797T_21093 [Gimesia maris DSM 8797]
MSLTFLEEYEEFYAETDECENSFTVWSGSSRTFDVRRCKQS